MTVHEIATPADVESKIPEDTHQLVVFGPTAYGVGATLTAAQLAYASAGGDPRHDDYVLFCFRPGLDFEGVDEVTKAVYWKGRGMPFKIGVSAG